MARHPTVSKLYETLEDAIRHPSTNKKHSLFAVTIFDKIYYTYSITIDSAKKQVGYKLSKAELVTVNEIVRLAYKIGCEQH